MSTETDIAANCFVAQALIAKQGSPAASIYFMAMSLHRVTFLRIDWPR